jgi:type IV fimbrial biogenesis protein FimT
MKQTHLPLGQSLIETLCVLVIVAILCGMGATSFQRMQTKIQVQMAAEDMLNAVLTARTQALRRESRVTVCVANISQTTPACAPANAGIAANFQGSWQQGWLMFEDPNNNGQWDAGEVLLEQHSALNSKVWAQGNATVNRYISFGASGRSLALNGAFQAGTLSFCDMQNRQAQGWLLVINAVGRPRLERSTMNACP